MITNSNVYFSLLKPQKYVARRSNKENQSISTITNDGGPGGGGGNSSRHLNSQQQALNAGGAGAGGSQGIYDNNRHTQVKTYMDHGNGHGIRTVGSSHYSKVRRICYLNAYYFECIFRFTSL